LTVQWVGDNAF